MSYKPNSTIHGRLAEALERREALGDAAERAGACVWSLPNPPRGDEDFGRVLAAVLDLNAALAVMGGRRARALDLALADLHTDWRWIALMREDYHRVRTLQRAWRAVLEKHIETQAALLRAARRATAGHLPAQRKK